MFAIYNNGSVGFRSTVDNLYELKNLDAPNKVSLKPNDDDLFQEYMTSKKQNNERQALDTYKKMVNIDTKEPIFHVKDIMTKEVVTVESNIKVSQSYEKLKDTKLSQIPVLDEQKAIIGLINKKMILNMIMNDLTELRNILNRNLSDLYFNEVLTTDPITDIRRVAKVMIDFKLDAIPVVNNKDELVGIVSKSDIIKAVSNIPKLQLWS